MVWEGIFLSITYLLQNRTQILYCSSDAINQSTQNLKQNRKKGKKLLFFLKIQETTKHCRSTEKILPFVINSEPYWSWHLSRKIYLSIQSILFVISFLGELTKIKISFEIFRPLIENDASNSIFLLTEHVEGLGTCIPYLECLLWKYLEFFDWG